jgi:hypothetical protein
LGRGLADAAARPGHDRHASTHVATIGSAVVSPSTKEL